MPISARTLLPCLALGAAPAAIAQGPVRPSYHSYAVTVSPDARHILFMRDSAGQRLALIANADGSDARPAPRGFMPVSWFPDGKRFLGILPPATRRDPTRLVTANADGTDIKEIPTGGASLMGGARLLGDGRTVFFIAPGRDSSGRPSMEVSLLDIERTTLRRVPMPAIPGRAVPPIAPSADGRRLAMTIADTTDPTSYARSTTLYVMNIDGSGLRDIATMPDLLEQAAWSPDGRQIVAVQGGRTPPIGTPMPRDHVPDAHLVVFDLETGAIRPIKHPGRKYQDEVPFWASNGYIYFQSDRDGSMEIYRMKPDGSAQERITAPPRKE